ncbi:hypothetical protein [Bacillus sp. 1P06AnD]|uniref:hypothetical protein n=1 Tax=Bacillus sp. 1P06AnD TaxID=3132208 RepID=UPI0039A0D982
MTTNNVINFGSAYTLEKDVPQITTLTGALKNDIESGTYTVKTEVLKGSEVLAKDSYDLVVAPK